MSVHGWEDAKENAQPLREGRKAASISHLLDSPPKMDAIMAQRARFESTIAASGGSDPLASWLEYLAWIELNDATGGEVFLDRKGTLERCLSKFKDYPEYKNDDRFVRKVCLKYVDVCESPLDLFSGMRGAGIGVRHKVMYAAWCMILEQTSKYTDAAKIYELGITELEQNEDKKYLQSKLKEFQHRWAQYETRRDQQGNSPQKDPVRASLAEMKMSRKGRVGAGRTKTSKKASGLKLPTGSINGANTGNSNGFTIFSDSGNQPHSTAQVPVAGGNGWSSSALPIDSTTTKENKVSAGKWDGKKTALGGAVVAPAKPDFAIFDDGSGEQVAESLCKPRHAQETGRRAFEAVKPKKHFQLKDYAKERGSSKIVDGALLAYDVVGVYGGGEELSFEELRGRSWLSKNQIPVEMEQDDTEFETNMDVEMEIDEPSQTHIDGPLQTGDENLFGLIGHSGTTGSFGTENAQAAPEAALPVERTVTKQLNFEDMTATSLAGSMQGHFGMRSPIQERLPAGSSSPTMTINTKEAMADVMAMFSGDPIGEMPSEPVEAVRITAASSQFVIYNDVQSSEGRNLDNSENQAPLSYSQPSVSVAESKGVTSRSALTSLPFVEIEPSWREDVETNPPSIVTGKQEDCDLPSEDAELEAGPSISRSFLQSTPFPSGPIEKTSGPSITPISSIADADTHNHQGEYAEVYEGHSLSPILEASQESTSIASDSSTSSLSISSSQITPGAASEVISMPVTDKMTLLLANRVAKSHESAALGCLMLYKPPTDVLDVGCRLYLNETTSLVLCVKQRLSSQFLAKEVPIDQENHLCGLEPGIGPYIIIQIHETVNPWLYYISTALSKKVTTVADEDFMGEHDARRLFLQARSHYVHGSTSFTLLDSFDQGNLQEILDMHTANNKPMEERLVMFYAIELLRMLELIRRCGVVHGEIKASSILLRNDQMEGEQWSLTWTPEGKGGWNKHGLVLSGFDRAIDTSLLREEESYGREIDTQSVVSIVHQMLYNSPLMLKSDENGRISLEKRLAPYWQGKIWTSFFRMMLNDEQPDFPALKTTFEKYLVGSSHKNSLRRDLRQQDMRLFEKRQQQQQQQQ